MSESELQTAPKQVWIIKQEQQWLKDHADRLSDGWYCKKTGAEIEMIAVGRSIWSDHGPGPCAGSGEVRTVFHIRCPRCSPPFNVNHGSPIQEGDLFSSENG